MMRLSELNGKEVINLGDGARLGVIDECEVMFDDESGMIATLEVPDRGGFFRFFGDMCYISIPWQAIRRIGDEVIIVDLSESYDYNILKIKTKKLAD